MKPSVFFSFFLLLCTWAIFADIQGGGSLPEFVQLQKTTDGRTYGITYEEGFFVTPDGSAKWEHRSQGLPRKAVYPFGELLYQRLTYLYIDPENPDRIIITTSNAVYLSENGGSSWEPVPLSSPFKSVMVITSAAISSDRENSILVGTSFSGVFETRDRGKSWTRLSGREDLIYRGAGFYEEISSLCYSGSDPDRIYLATGFENRLYSLDRPGRVMTRINSQVLQEKKIYRLIPQTVFAESGLQGIRCETEGSAWLYLPDSGEWAFLENIPSPASPPGQIQTRRDTAAGRTGIYLSRWNARGESLDAHIAFLKEHGLNSIVIDMKDDMGVVTYDSDLEVPRQAEAVAGTLNMDDLLEKAHAEGIYIIGRIVVFKDPKFYAFKDNAYAVWDYEADAPWGKLLEAEDPETGEISYEQREFWVDPYAEEVWNYNIAIARELEEKGIDEIQFDYIRFPTEGDFSVIQYRHRKEYMGKTEAIESFLKKAREALSIPVSVDIFGFNGWYRMGNWNGQNIEVIARYADVICPMYYPSHFPRDFMEKEPYLDRAEQIYYQGTLRAQAITEGRAFIRPFVQAFLIGGELNFEEPVYSAYLTRQLDGVKNAQGTGFTLWNNTNRYYMVTSTLLPYTEK